MYCYILNIEAVGSWFQKIFFKSYSPLYGKPEGLANLEPRVMVGMIYVGDHRALLYTNLVYKLWALWLWYRRFLKFSSKYKGMRDIDSNVHDKFSPKGLLCRAPVDKLNIQAITSWFQRRYFYVFPTISI